MRAKYKWLLPALIVDRDALNQLALTKSCTGLLRSKLLGDGGGLYCRVLKSIAP